MSKLRTMGKLGILACTLLTGTGAFATDGKVYPGATCRALTGGSFVNYGGTVMNSSSTSELEVICPFVRDTGSIEGGVVVTYDRNSTKSVACTIVSEMATATGLTASIASTSSGNAYSSTTDVVVSPFGSIAGGDYTYATCSVPRTASGNASHIAGFSINEST